MSKPDLDRDIDALKDKQYSPMRDLWPGVERKMITNELSPKHINRLTTLAASTLAASLFIMCIVFFTQHTPTQPAPEISEAIDLIEHNFHIQKTHLLSSYDNQTPYIQNLDEELNEIEEAKTLVKEALIKSPDNLYLIGILNGLNDKQIKIIRSVYSQHAYSI